MKFEQHGATHRGAPSPGATRHWRLLPERHGADATLRPMRLSQVLFSQGFGTRRDCTGLIASGEVQWQGRVLDDPHEDLPTDLPEPGLVLQVQGRDWPYHASALLLLNKPAGFECSQKPKHHPSVLSLLPTPLRTRGVQPVGRLDEDTTGLLLLTDDGKLIHQLTHPKKNLSKVYEVQTKHPLDEGQVSALLDGVTLLDDPEPARAVAARLVGPHHLQLSLTEGRYHQVKRMLAAVGNRVEALHRSAFGAVSVPTDLGPGQWCWLRADTVF